MYLKTGVLGRKNTTARTTVADMRLNLQITFFFIKPPKILNKMSRLRLRLRLKIKDYLTLALTLAC
jgi:hypothetical protein